MKVKIKKLHEDAVIPSYARDGDAGMDLTAVEDGKITEQGTQIFKTGLSMEIPKGYVGLIFPRSSVFKTTARLNNCVGVIDSGYRGEIMVNFDPSIQSYMRETNRAYNPPIDNYKKGDRVAQIIILPYPEIEFELTDELSSTERGEGGHGSTN